MALDPVTAGIDFAGKILDKLFPDPEQRAAAELQLQQIKQSSEVAQISVNQEEAKSDNLFVAGWRPWIGWVCGVAFAYHFVIEPFFMLLVTCYRGICVKPDFDMETLTTVLMGMLGLGTLRSFEKVAGVQNTIKLPWKK